jgi:hypothetical protein
MRQIKALQPALTKWELLPYNLRGGLALIDAILLCSMMGGCSSYSFSTRNNEDGTVACVDRNLSNGDSCSGQTPGQGPVENVPHSE